MATNESEIEMSESAVMSGLEAYSTPNVGQDNKTSEFNVTSKINVTDDSGIQITPKLIKESNQPENNMMKYLCLSLIHI